MKKSSGLALLLVSCAVDYHVDDAEFQCQKFGRCGDASVAPERDGATDVTPSGGSNAVGGNGGAGGSSLSGGASGSGAGGGGTGGGTPIDCPSDVPCTNPDAAHCLSECELADGGVACVVRGRDGDGDRHGSSACKSATVLADDCDDANRDVHPGATEACNGIDDDCNGKADVDDGLPLGGAPAKFAQNGERPVSIRWSQTARAYGIGWTEADAADSGARRNHVHFAPLDARGNAISGQDTDLTPPDEDEVLTDMALGANDFRMLTVTNGGTSLDFRTVAYLAPDAGTPMTKVTATQHVGTVPATSRPTLVALDLFSVATWFEVAPDTSSLANYSAILTGSPIGSPTITPVDARTQRDIASAHVGAVASYAFVSCTIPGHGDAGASSDCSTQMKIIDFTTTPATEYGPFAVTAPKARPVMASLAGNDSAFAVGWVENDTAAWSFDYAIVSTDGRVLCGPTRYMTRAALPETALGFRDAPSIAPAPDGSFFALVPYGVSMMFLAKLDAACKNVESTPLAVSPASHGFVGSPQIAASGKSVVAMWTDTLATTTIQIRKMSPLLCDAP